MSCLVDAVKFVRKSVKGPQSITEDAEYFPNYSRLLFEGDGKVWLLNNRGEKDYSRNVAQIIEIAHCKVWLN